MSSRHRRIFALSLFLLPWGFLFAVRFPFCREVFLFAVRLFFLPRVFFFLLWGYSFCREVFPFCREVNSLAVTVAGHWGLWSEDYEFVWDKEVHGQRLDRVKQVLTKAPVFSEFFGPQKMTVLQCDASMSGLGVCLMQDMHPVAFASRALTLLKRNY